MQNKSHLYLFTLFLVIYEFTVYAANDMIMPAMLSITTQFNSPVSVVSLSLSIYLMGNALLQLFLGPLSDRVGKRKIIIFGNIAFLVFSILLALSVNMPLFLLGRLLQGSGLAFIAMGYALVHENFNDQQAVKITSIMANVTVFAPILGPIIGGTIITYVSWRYVFVFSVITGLVSLYGLIKYAPHNKTIATTLNFKQIIKGYYKIFIMPKFLIGNLSLSLLFLPSMCWIALSPVIIVHTLHLSLNHYMLYQAIALLGFLISSTINQLLAGRITMMQLIILGFCLSIIGFFGIIIFRHEILLISFSLAFVCSGVGIQIATIYRILAKLEVQNMQGMLFSLMSFVQIIVLAITLEIANTILCHYNYSLNSFIGVLVGYGSIAALFVLYFININKNRNWQ